MTRRFAVCLFVSLGTAGTLMGCGNGGISVPNTAPVRGTVLLRGRPVEGVLVTFHPQFDIGAVKFTPSATTDKDGKFSLSTAAPNDGAPPGAYAVTFAYPRIESDRKNSGIEVEVDAWQGKYGDPAASQWKVQVQSGENNMEPFQIN